LSFWHCSIQGHDYSLLLNEAYKILMRDISRHGDGSAKSRAGWGSGYTGDGYSSWNGPVRSQALFVDENKCIGTYQITMVAVVVLGSTQATTVHMLTKFIKRM
jgi:hypothetical protein